MKTVLEIAKNVQQTVMRANLRQIVLLVRQATIHKCQVLNSYAAVVLWGA